MNLELQNCHLMYERYSEEADKAYKEGKYKKSLVFSDAATNELREIERIRDTEIINTAILYGKIINQENKQSEERRW